LEYSIDHNKVTYRIIDASYQKSNKKIDYSYDVFLCHNSADKESVKDIYSKLKAKGIKSWLDIYELQPGKPWQRELEKQIKSIKSVAVFVGQNGVGPWHKMELEAFIREFIKRECPVIPVILKGCNKVPELPPFLDGMTYVNFNKSSPSPLKQLIWGITGKRPE
jgi:hypothetical protein